MGNKLLFQAHRPLETTNRFRLIFVLDWTILAVARFDPGNLELSATPNPKITTKEENGGGEAGKVTLEKLAMDVSPVSVYRATVPSGWLVYAYRTSGEYEGKWRTGV